MYEIEGAGTQSADFSADSAVYLKPTTKMEPLVCGWLAWTHLLAPVQAAMNFSYRYLPLLQSFVANPLVHVAATKDPKLFGGPFVHLAPQDVPQVKELIATTRQQFGRLLQLADDAKSFNTALQDSSRGFSLNDVHAKLPASLAGMVELMYDIDNHPRIRLLEELLYAEYGADLRKGAQQIALTDVTESERRFFMSTPRMKSPRVLTLSAEYSNPDLDILASMRLEPARLRDLEAAFGLEDLARRYGHLFTSDAPERKTPEHSGDDVRIRYFGHACVLVQTSTMSILIDPMFACEPDMPGAQTCARFTISDLPDTIDYVVLSHCHQDHCSAEMLLQIRHRVGKVVIPTNNRGSITDPSMKLILRQLGFFNVICLDYFESVCMDGGRLVSIPFPGEHSDLDVYSKQSLFLEVKGRRLLFLVDSDGRDVALYQKIAKQIAGGDANHIDALFLGMECHGAPLTWLYGPLLSKPITRRDDESRRLSGSNYERALRIVQQFNCDRVYVYAMGQEPWLRYVMGLEYAPESIQLTESAKLIEHCRSSGMISERLYGCQDIFM